MAVDRMLEDSLYDAQILSKRVGAVYCMALYINLLKHYSEIQIKLQSPINNYRPGCP